MMLTPSRHLNNEKTIFGLDLKDLMASLFVLSICNIILENTRLEFLSVVMSILLLVALVPIRVKYRRKIIRDFLWFHLTSGVIYDPRFASKTKSC